MLQNKNSKLPYIQVTYITVLVGKQKELKVDILTGVLAQTAEDEK